MEHVEQATAAPGEKRDIPPFCKHDELIRQSLGYECPTCGAEFDVVESRHG